ncbi:MAG TPA: ATP-binding cassette domain-containing protein [Ktedonobacterales bacterium]
MASVQMREATAQPESAAGESIIRTQGLTKRFGARLAVDGLSLEVRRGDVFALLGPNGSGKTTTLRMLLGLNWPTAGAIQVFGMDMTDPGSRQAALRRIGSVVEQPTFYPYLNAVENLNGAATFSGLAGDANTRARVQWALHTVGLLPRATDAYRKYSLGMKQRLGIAAALLTDPELVILDEPTNGLDPAGITEMRGLIGALHASGVTVLLSTHLLHEAQQVCTRVAVLQVGRLVAQGGVNELLSAGRGVLLGFASEDGSYQAAKLLREANLSWAPSGAYIRPDLGSWAPPGGWFLLVAAPHERAAELNALLVAAGLPPAEVRRYEVSLEQYFLSLTGAFGVAAQGAPAFQIDTAGTGVSS